MMNIKEEKKKLRKQVIEQLQMQPLTERNLKSTRICNKILTSRAYLEAQAVMFYAAMTYEVETNSLIDDALKRKKHVILPLLDRRKREITTCEIKSYENDTELCEYGFREPHVSLQDNWKKPFFDLIVVPGICFDRQQYRLGRGAGYYDRFLARVAPHTITVGLAFDFQVFDAIPHEKHDVPLTMIVSNT